MATPVPPRIQLPPYSMWAATSIYQAVGPDKNPAIVFGLLQDIVVADPSDTLYTVPAGGINRLDLISQSFYGVPDMWWVLARVNTILDPLVGAAIGTVIRIPTKSRLSLAGILSS